MSPSVLHRNIWRWDNFALVDANPIFVGNGCSMRMFPYMLITVQFFHDKLMCVEDIPIISHLACWCSHVGDSAMSCVCFHTVHIRLGDICVLRMSRPNLAGWWSWHFDSCPFDKTDTPFHPLLTIIFPYWHTHKFHIFWINHHAPSYSMPILAFPCELAMDVIVLIIRSLSCTLQHPSANHRPIFLP